MDTRAYPRVGVFIFAVSRLADAVFAGGICATTRKPTASPRLYDGSGSKSDAVAGTKSSQSVSFLIPLVLSNFGFVGFPF